jgi:hypothetical protein
MGKMQEWLNDSSNKESLDRMKILFEEFGLELTFTENDWYHLHDAILTATWNTEKKMCNLKELVGIYLELPLRLKLMAQECGMNDTEFREGVIKYWEEKIKHDSKSSKQVSE